MVARAPLTPNPELEQVRGATRLALGVALAGSLALGGYLALLEIGTRLGGVPAEPRPDPYRLHAFLGGVVLFCAVLIARWEVRRSFLRALALAALVALPAFAMAFRRSELRVAGEPMVAALEAHQGSHGTYPETLAAVGVTPPDNPWGGWHYEPEAEDFHLWCGDDHRWYDAPRATDAPRFGFHACFSRRGWWLHDY